MKQSYDSIKSKTGKRNFVSNLKLNYVKKYNLVSTTATYFPLAQDKTRSKTYSHVRQERKKMLGEAVHEFFLYDANTTMAPGKRDTITRDKIKKQKRYLNNTLKFLHIKFCEKQFLISYSLLSTSTILSGAT